MDLNQAVNGHKFLRTYLRFNAKTESPPLFHLWAGMTAASAALGRKLRMPYGNSYVYPNMYTLLVGPPSVRKSTAIRVARDLLKAATNVKFCADDVAGQRQGLLASLADDYISDDAENNKRYSKATAAASTDDMLHSFLDEEITLRSPLDAGALFICADEFVIFSGTNSPSLIGTLADLYDNKPDHKYRLKSSEIIIQSPTLQLLSAISPSQLVNVMPPDAINHSFLSRLMLIFADERPGKIFLPTGGSEEDRTYLEYTLQSLYHLRQTDFSLSKEAAAYLEAQYMSEEVEDRLTDPRLQHYVNRRHVHALKVLMCLVALDNRFDATLADAKLVESLMQHAESLMADAMGDYGISPEARIRQRLVEYMASQKRLLSFLEIHNAMMADCPNRVEFHNILISLVEAGRLVRVDCVDPVDKTSVIAQFGHKRMLASPTVKASILTAARMQKIREERLANLQPKPQDGTVNPTKSYLN